MFGLDGETVLDNDPLVPEGNTEMASRTIDLLEDDLSGSAADETVSFSLDGVPYEIDLTASNAQAMRDALSTYIEHARFATKNNKPKRTTKPRSQATYDPKEIRIWAKTQGIDVPDRGRLPQVLVEKYQGSLGSE